MNECHLHKRHALSRAGHSSCKHWGQGAPPHTCRGMSGSDPPSVCLLGHEAHLPDHSLTIQGALPVLWPEANAQPRVLRRPGVDHTLAAVTVTRENMMGPRQHPSSQLMTSSGNESRFYPDLCPSFWNLICRAGRMTTPSWTIMLLRNEAPAIVHWFVSD